MNCYLKYIYATISYMNNLPSHIKASNDLLLNHFSQTGISLYIDKDKVLSNFDSSLYNFNNKFSAFTNKYIFVQITGLDNIGSPKENFNKVDYDNLDEVDDDDNKFLQGTETESKKIEKIIWFFSFTTYGEDKIYGFEYEKFNSRLIDKINKIKGQSSVKAIIGPNFEVPENMQKILLCLEQTYKAHDNKLREQAEKELAVYKNENIITFCENISYILKLPENQIDNNLKLAAILQLKRSVEDKLQKNVLKNDEHNKIIQIFISIIVIPYLTKNQLKNIGEALSSLLDQTITQKNCVLLDLVNYLEPQIQNMPLSSVAGMIKILTCIINSKALKVKIFETVLETTLSMVSVINKNLFINLNNMKNTNLSQEDYIKFISLFTDIYELLQLCFYIRKKRFTKNTNIESVNAINNYFEEAAKIGIQLLINDSQDNNKIISWTNTEILDKNINNLRQWIFRYINGHILNVKSFVTSEQKNKFDIFIELIKIVVNNLEWVVNYKLNFIQQLDEDNKTFSDFGYTQLISFMIGYLNKIYRNDNFRYTLDNIEQNIFKNILLPLMIITEGEIKECSDKDKADTYDINIKDILESNKAKNIKSSVGALIKTLFDKNKKIRNFILNYISCLLLKIFDNNYSNIELLQSNDVLVTFLTNDQQIIKCKILDMSLLVLCTINNSPSSLKENKHKIDRKCIQNAFEKIKQNLLNLEMPPYVKQKIMYFIKGFIPHFYELDSEQYYIVLKYLFDNMFDPYYLVSSTAGEIINNFFAMCSQGSKHAIDPSHFLRKNLMKAADVVLMKISELIINVRGVSNFFDVLYELVRNIEYLKEDDDNKSNPEGEKFIETIFCDLCKRVKIEMERHNRIKFKVEKKNKRKTSKSEEYQVIINKCFNVIRLILNDHLFIKAKLAFIEGNLSDLLTYMEAPKKIEFDEDLIMITNTIIKITENVDDFSLKLFGCLNKYIDKCNGMYPDSYELLNSFITYGSKIINTNNKLVEQMFNMFVSSIKSKKSDKSAYYACCLFQVWFLYNNNLPKELISNVLMKSIEKLNEIYTKYEKKEDISDSHYSFLGFVTLIFCAMINYDIMVIDELIKSKKSEEFFSKWINLIIIYNNVTYEYQIKILVNCICKIIQSKKYNNLFVSITNFAKKLLKSQALNGVKELKRASKINFNFKSDDEESDDEEENIINNDNEEDEEDYYDKYGDRHEIKDAVKKTNNPIKNEDEFKVFSSTLRFAQNELNDIFNNWWNNLDENNKKDFIKLMGTQRILVNIRNEKNNKIKKFIIPRRILKIKRNNII